MGCKTGAYSLKERDHLKDEGVDGKIILRLTLKKSFGRART